LRNSREFFSRPAPGDGTRFSARSSGAKARRASAAPGKPGPVAAGRQPGFLLERQAHVLHVLVAGAVRDRGQRQVGFRQQFLDALDLDARYFLVGRPAR
jgi:hypothetical protein